MAQIDGTDSNPTVEPNIRVLKNGTKYDMEKHRFASGPLKPHFTKENSAQMQQLAMQGRQRKAARRAVAAVEEFTGRSGLKPSDVGAEIAHELTKSTLVNALDKPRDVVPTAKLVLQLIGQAPAEQPQQEQRPRVVIQVNAIVADGIRRLFPEVFEGEARELED